ncbi:GntR family transcriptional regulator [Raoultella terrigena]|uniref:GntR family transcriptional regulator n=1 Tax=Raoultella terrigena TaxID=577 RepID=UPI001F5182DA|nr:GntR family transcriptional regulator [Raoultella terrigena]MCI1034826.1 GntR family transcriptional regulator [Raoultella terrigena]
MNETRKDFAYSYIKKNILADIFRQGQPLIELELSRELDISRAPVREALRALEAEGLVKSYPGRGTIVAEISPSDIEEIFELRVMLETGALEKSLKHITDTELNEVENIFRIAFHSSSLDKLHEADRKLHQLITSKCGNRRLIEYITILNTQIERVRKISIQDPNRMLISYEEHLDIISKIKSRDYESCKKALVSHLRSVSNSAIEYAKINKQ